MRPKLSMKFSGCSTNADKDFCFEKIGSNLEQL